MVAFTVEHGALRKLVRDFAEKEIGPHADEWEANGIFPAHELFPKLGELGLLGLEYDPAYGGQGADHSLHGDPAARNSAASAPPVWPVASAVQTDMATPSLHRYGSEELKQRYLAPAIARRAGRLDRGDRARRRLRRGRAQHPCGARRRRLGHQRLEALHHQRHPGRLALPAGPHVRRAGLPAACRRSWSRPTPPASRSAASSTSSACGPPTRPSCRSPTCGSRSATRSARSAAASSSRWPSSRTSASITVLHPRSAAWRLALDRTADYLQRAPRLRQAAARQPARAIHAGRADRATGHAAALQLRGRRGLHRAARTPPGSPPSAS